MFKTKDEQERTERNWDFKCADENLRCAHCNQFPPYEEREIFFDTGACGKCAYTLEKDD